MKKIICLLLMVVMIFTVVCGIAEESAIDKLEEKEKRIYDALLIMLNNFYDPSSVRVMELRDYTDRSKYRESTLERDKMLAGPDTVIVRLSGANRLGGTLNNYYLLCLSDFTTPYFSSLRTSLTSAGLIGDYAELAPSDSQITRGWKFSDSSVGNINRALKEHWEILGF